MNIDQEIHESLYELVSVLNQQTIFEEILRLVTSKITALLNANVVSIVLINPSTLETVKTVMKVEDKSAENKYQLAQTNIIGWAMKNAQSFISNDLENDSRFVEDISVKSAMCVALEYFSKIFGYIVVLNNDLKDAYDNNSLRLLERISNISAPYINQVQKIQKYFSAPLSDESIIYKYLQLGLIGKSEAFLSMLQSVESAAKCDARVVLEGTTGTGKELIARAIHKLSVRSQHPFIAIDCGAIQESLMESELFGHVQGAFTGAIRDRRGLIVEADKGTLFMDEINNLPLEMQSKLLRVLQEGEVRQVGSNKKIKVDVRIISASSLSLSKEVAKKVFREDLFYRLMVYPIYIPTLEERKRDIPLLAHHFLNKYSKEQNKRIGFFHSDIIQYLKSKRWPGNIRELENYIERIVSHVNQNTEILDKTTFPEYLDYDIEKFNSNQESMEPLSLKESLFEHEKQMILKALEVSNWNQTKAAKSLKLLEGTLRAKMKKLGIYRDK